MQFTGAALHGGQTIVTPTAASANASVRQVIIMYPPERDSGPGSRTYQGVSVTISPHRIPAFENREFYIAILAREQIEYEELNDAVRGFMTGG